MKLINKLKSNPQLAGIAVGVGILVIAVIIVLTAVLFDLFREEGIDEIDVQYANTEGMDFGFDDDSAPEGGSGPVIDLGEDKSEPTEESSDPAPTEEPTEGNSGPAPTEEPTEGNSDPAPTEEPTEGDSDPAPTEEPTEGNSDPAPTEKPTEEPTEEPTEKPTEKPTEGPTEKPTEEEPEEPEEPEPVNITAGGTYTLKGNRKDIMITVDAGEAEVTLILDGVTLNNSKGPAIYVRSAGKVYLTLASGTVSTLSDGSSYRISDAGSTLDGAIFSKADLTVNGSGTLNVTGNYKHGIVSKDDLVISSGTLNITARNVALSGKDSVKIKDGNIVLKAGSDGIRADNTLDSTKGYVYLYGGKVNITAGNDGIQAYTVLNIENTDLTVVSGGGSGNKAASTASHKGLKAGSDIYVSGGKFNVDSADDAIHADGTVAVTGGEFTLSTADDGIHADKDISISGDGTKIRVEKSFDGIEAGNILIKGGTVTVKADDDGLNAASSVEVSDPSDAIGSAQGKVVVNGGTVTLKVGGVAVNSKSTVAITGGTVVASTPDGAGKRVLDYSDEAQIKGGKFIATGDSAKAKNFSATSTQGAILVNTGAQAAGTTVTVKDSSGKVILTATAEQSYSCIILSAPEIVKDGKYTVTAGSYTADITMDSLIYG